MLVLSRKNKESVVIGMAGDMQELIRVTVLEVRGGSVRLGFAADDDVAVFREEVWERIRAESPTPDRKPIAPPPKYLVPYID